MLEGSTVHLLRKRGYKKKEIARTVGCHRNTVSKEPFDIIITVLDSQFFDLKGEFSTQIHKKTGLKGR